MNSPKNYVTLWSRDWKGGEVAFIVYFMYVLYFFFLNYLSVYFIFGCAGSSLLCEGFLKLWRAGATLQVGCAGF